jgi:Response regulator with putative antiterminator output domain
MDSVLIISNTEKNTNFFTEMLNAVSPTRILTLTSCSEARRLLLEQDFDLVIINAPLRDESGEILSKNIASKGICQVILIVQTEFYDDVTSVTEDYGVMTIAKPINKNIFWSALKLAKSAQNKMKLLKTENNKLIQKIEDIRIVDRAKCILISYLNMSEQEAHRYIEKQAMDMRISKRLVAEGIIKTYEN